MYLLCARHLHLRPSLFFGCTNGRELNKDVFCRHVSIWSSASTFCTPLFPLNPLRRVRKRKSKRWCGKVRAMPPLRLGSIQRKAEASTARADHCITQACCFLNLTTDIKLVGVRCCHVGIKDGKNTESWKEANWREHLGKDPRGFSKMTLLQAASCPTNRKRLYQ